MSRPQSLDWPITLADLPIAPHDIDDKPMLEQPFQPPASNDPQNQAPSSKCDEALTFPSSFGEA
jgi:hypothetical protein